MFYVPSGRTSSIVDGELPKSASVNSQYSHLSPMSQGLLAFQKRRGVGSALLTITIVQGRNLPVMDPNGKSDPYCIVAIGGNEARTGVQYSTLNPEWRETLQFDISDAPQLLQNNDAGDGIVCCLTHYLYIEVWDKDTLNRDDFMGQIMVPVSKLSEQTLSGWYPLGRLTPRDAVSGEIYLEMTLKSDQPIKRWNADHEIYSACKKRIGFELPILAGSQVIDFPGEAEHVEMVLDDVVVEVSKHRGIGRVYLTDYRLVIICNPSGHTAAGHNTDMSMWVALNNIQSVDRGEDEKVVRRTVHGNAGFSDVKTFIIRCWDFRTIHLTFMNSQQSGLTFFASPTGTASSQSSPDSVPGSTQPAQNQSSNGKQAVSAVGSGNGSDIEQVNSSENGSAGSSCDLPKPAVTVGQPPLSEQGQTNVANADITRCSSQSSFQVLSRSSSSSSSVVGVSSQDSGDGPLVPHAVSAILAPGIIAAAGAAGSDISEAAMKIRSENLYSQSFLPFYINALYRRLDYITLNAVDSPPSKGFVSSQPQEFELSGWNVYDFSEEFRRQQVNDRWRITNINQEFGLCSSYPELLYTPTEIEDTTLRECASFRSKSRLPGLCWYNSKKGNFIMRCAQPKTGPMAKYSLEDECVINTAMKCNMCGNKLVIFDARSVFAAGGNRLKGKGTEDTLNRYVGCKLMFLDIPNIHAVRDSFDRLQVVCESSSQKKWLSHLESTQWLAYISAILKGAVTIGRYVDEKGVAALVHCSDGWDRTSQLTSLAQLLLDPDYRTMKGFQVLIEKEWISFGHKFRERLGHPSCPSQRSPVFLQFLDCAWQIWQQFPSAFEFTASYLVRIADHINSQWFGNFLCNNVKERRDIAAATRTVSLWSHLDAALENFLNPSYSRYNEVLLPVCGLRRLRLWSDYFLRFDESAWAVQESSLDDTEESGTEPNEFKSVGQMVDTVVWVPDERVNECTDCRQRFSHFKRKHHCRACGQVFCGDCTKQRIRLPQFGYTTPERVCDNCHQVNRDRTREEEEEEDFEVINFPALSRDRCQVW